MSDWQLVDNMESVWRSNRAAMRELYRNGVEDTHRLPRLVCAGPALAHGGQRVRDTGTARA